MNSNKYGSFINTFFAADMFNDVLPVTPPADLSLSAGSDMCESYFSFRNSAGGIVPDFNINDNPYFRGIGLTSNMADGLVDASSAHYGSSSSWQLVITPQQVSADLTGTISNSPGSAAIAGAGTLFTQEVCVGATLVWRDGGGVLRSGVVLSIGSDTALVLTSVTASTGMYQNFTVGESANILTGIAGGLGNSITIPILMLNTLQPYSFPAANVSLLTSLTGKISTVAGDATVTGSGTRFQSEFTAGQIFGWVDDTGTRRTGKVSSITSNTSLELTAVATSQTSNKAMLTLANSIRLKAGMVSTFNAYTIAIDPSFATRLLSISAYAEIEHSFAMSGSF